MLTPGLLALLHLNIPSVFPGLLLVQPITHYVIYYLDIEVVIDETVDEHEDQPEV